MLRIYFCLVNLALLAALIVAPVAAQEATPTPEFSSFPIVTRAPTLPVFTPTPESTSTPTPVVTPSSTPAPMITPVNLKVCAGIVAQSCVFLPIGAR